ncbi:amino acid deaminase [Kineosporia sp. J2-2]|uniref:Amino acid deaminase n=1 Tax=Kineosporia corallincola TaxID=2835133 RepID=A0ABS5TFC5_9ACTN|nr:alanine racemase [Kineosporia corallincola]MBT0768309.1 amino acid deaminase [Kineosporia corallincola]
MASDVGNNSSNDVNGERLRAKALDELADLPVAVTEKGWGSVVSRGVVTARSLRANALGLHDGDFTFPLAVLDRSALAGNITAMARWCEQHGVRLAPHGKTYMSPEIAHQQLAAGAWAITVAGIAQLQAYHAYGVRRFVVANQLADRAGVGWLARQLAVDADLRVWVNVDSVAGVEFLAAELSRAGARRPLEVLVELGHPGGRTGARSVETARAVAVAVAACPDLNLAGVSGYEGTLGHHGLPEENERVAAWAAGLARLGDDLFSAGLLAPGYVVSAGGSAFPDVVTHTLKLWAYGGDPVIVLRSGAYAVHDDGYYASVTPSGRQADGPVLRPALSVWAPVLSRPEPELALLLLGRRDAGFDEGLPVPREVRHRDGLRVPAQDMEVTALNDQHGFLRVPAGSALGPGDLVHVGISHPCTTLDKWRVIAVVDEDEQVVDLVHTFF